MTNKKRPKSTQSITERVETGCGKLYITISFLDNEVFEVFAVLGKAGGCATCFLQAITTCITMGLRNGVPLDVYVKKLIGFRCPSPLWDDGIQYLSCVDAISKVLEKHKPVAKEETC